MDEISNITVFRSYHEAASMLSDKQRLEFYDGLFSFAFDGIQPAFADDVMLRLAWSLVEPNVRKSIENQLNGKKGGRPRKEQD